MPTPSYSLNLDEFRRYAREGNLIPLYREILADYETPVSAFAKIDHGPTAYLLESIEGGEKWARYSFLGSGSPVVIYEDRGDLIHLRGKRKKRIPSRGNPLERLRELMSTFRPVTVPNLPRFVGGAVGYLSYDIVRRRRTARPAEGPYQPAGFRVSPDRHVSDFRQRRPEDQSRGQCPCHLDPRPRHQASLPRGDRSDRTDDRAPETSASKNAASSPTPTDYLYIKYEQGRFRKDGGPDKGIHQGGRRRSNRSVAAMGDQRASATAAALSSPTSGEPVPLHVLPTGGRGGARRFFTGNPRALRRWSRICPAYRRHASPRA